MAAPSSITRSARASAVTTGSPTSCWAQLGTDEATRSVLTGRTLSDGSATAGPAGPLRSRSPPAGRRPPRAPGPPRPSWVGDARAPGRGPATGGPLVGPAPAAPPPGPGHRWDRAPRLGPAGRAPGPPPGGARPGGRAPAPRRGGPAPSRAAAARGGPGCAGAEGPGWTGRAPAPG